MDIQSPRYFRTREWSPVSALKPKFYKQLVEVYRILSVGSWHVLLHHKITITISSTIKWDLIDRKIKQNADLNGKYSKMIHSYCLTNSLKDISPASRILLLSVVIPLLGLFVHVLPELIVWSLDLGVVVSIPIGWGRVVIIRRFFPWVFVGLFFFWWRWSRPMNIPVKLPKSES